jgi:preprotein translocase subunit SecF
MKGGPRYGIDFAGGAIAQIQFENPAEEETIKVALADSGLVGLMVQSFGDDDGRSFLLRVSTDDAGENISAAIAKSLAANMPDNPYVEQRLESVGPKVGADLRSQAIESMYFAILLIAIYISGRFEQRWMVAALMAAALAGGMYVLAWLGVDTAWRVLAAMLITLALCFKLRLVYALGAVVSILHDVLITIGIFSIMDKEFDLTIIAALLTILGYSLNDTIIVFDRIRENIRSNKGQNLMEILNRSINQTLSRTVLTSGTTLFVIGSLLAFGGGIIHDFALVMFIGVIVGTLSSVFVASPILLFFGDTIMAQAAAEKEAQEEAARKERMQTRTGARV